MNHKTAQFDQTKTATPSLDGLPVIIGTGLTGLCYSLELSKQGIRHILIGDPPTVTPKIGESLDLTASSVLLEKFSRYSQYFLPKESAAVYYGERLITFSFAFDKIVPAKITFMMAGLRTPEKLFHLDRCHLDAEMYKEAVQSDQCIALKERLADVDVTDQSITTLHLENGVSISPSFLISTIPVNKMQTKLGLQKKLLSPDQKTFFCHIPYMIDLSAPKFHQTHLIQLNRDRDDVNAMMWIIPSGDFLSLGFSMNANEDCSIETADRVMKESLRKIGFDRFNQENSLPLKEIKHQYFIMDEVYGKNWLLAGNSSASVSFLTSSGVGNGIVLTEAIPYIINGREDLLEGYKQYINGLAGAHKVFEDLRYDNHIEFNESLAHQYFDTLFIQNVNRTANYLAVNNSIRQLLIGKLMILVGKIPGIIYKYAHVGELNLNQVKKCENDDIYCIIDDSLDSLNLRENFSKNVKIRIGKATIFGHLTLKLILKLLSQAARKQQAEFEVNSSSIISSSKPNVQVLKLTCSWRLKGRENYSFEVSLEISKGRICTVKLDEKLFAPILGNKVYSVIGTPLIFGGLLKSAL